MLSSTRALCLLACSLSGLTVGANADDNKGERYGLTLQELLQARVTGVGSLTESSRVNIPAATTRISQVDIRASGARSMLALLVIDIPGVQVIRHHYELPHLGVRGITSDKEDKIMIRVYGRVMNERIGRGAITARDFQQMGDIHHIDVIRGAGSSMCGLGAVAMVIDLTTFDAATSPGNRVDIRQGAGMEYPAMDLNFSHYFDNGPGLYFHAEAANVNGADDDDAPLVFGADATSVTTGEHIPRGHTFPTRVNDGQAFAGKPFLKAHLSLDYDETERWVRYTRAGREESTILQNLAEPPVGSGRTREFASKIGYEQLTFMLQHAHSLSDSLDLDLMLSLDRSDVTKIVPSPTAPPDDYHDRAFYPGDHAVGRGRGLATGVWRRVLARGI